LPSISTNAVRRISVWALILGACLLAAVGWHLWSAWTGTETTDNAYVQGDITPIAPKIPGYVAAVDIRDNETVHAGDVLFRIQDEDYRARLDAAKANVAMKEAALDELGGEADLQQAVIAQSRAGLAAANAEMQRTALDLERYTNLLHAANISRQIYERARATNLQAEAGVQSASATITASQRKLKVIHAQEGEAAAALNAARAAQALSQIDLNNTVVRAPVDGVIGNRSVRPGRYVTPGAPVLELVPVMSVWIVANFKETQLGHMKPGQKAEITVDGYSGTTLEGRVDSLAPGSGAAFSLLPPDNATGNFVRIVQRVPVKIQLAADNPLSGRLVPGLSASVTVDIAAAPGR
jgi:membrane fusion protein (multidrug efflux system)